MHGPLESLLSLAGVIPAVPLFSFGSQVKSACGAGQQKMVDLNCGHWLARDGKKGNVIGCLIGECYGSCKIV